MLPLTLLNAAQGSIIQLELKSGETYNGHLVSTDNWMNMNLKQVICTSTDGENFVKMTDAYIRGNTIKYLRVPDEIIFKIRDDQYANKRANQSSVRGRVGRGRGGNRGSK